MTKNHQPKRTLYEECNAVVSFPRKKEKLETLDTWIKPEGIYKILSTPNIEKAGYCVTYNSKEEWIMYTPELKIINFKHDSGDCEGIPYMDLRNTESGVTTIQTEKTTV